MFAGAKLRKVWDVNKFCGNFFGFNDVLRHSQSGKGQKWMRGFVVRQIFYNFAAVTTKITKNDEDANHTAAAATMGNRGRCGTL